MTLKRQEEMRLRNKIFDSYYSVHEKFLEGDIVIRQRWFNNLCEVNYASHLPVTRQRGRILELGCGKGYILKWMQEKGWSNTLREWIYRLRM